jgi:glycosyltransferase involved in cell wall biosynthesis
MKKILFIGPKSPPVSGYSNIVNELSKCIILLGANLKYVSTVPSTISFLFPSSIWKICRLIYLLILSPVIIILIPFYYRIYININGGYSQLFDALIVSTSRLFGKNITLHHNSYNYINNKKWYATLLFYVAGKSATHIVNCMDMEKKLCALYGHIRNVSILSNASILATANPKYFSTDQNLLPTKSIGVYQHNLTIGFMGYLNRDKGIDTFSKVVNRLNELCETPVKSIAVGPMHDAKLVQTIEINLKGMIEIRPPAYGNNRKDFFREIDILLFPSRYLSEAEPLTIHHALSSGVFVISTNIGCISEILKGLPCCHSYSIKNYVNSSVNAINYFLSLDLEERASARELLVNRYKENQIAAKNNLNNLFDQLFI